MHGRLRSTALRDRVFLSLVEDAPVTVKTRRAEPAVARSSVIRSVPARAPRPPCGLPVPRENILQLLPDAVVPKPADLQRYCLSVADRALAHLGRRPLKLVRHLRGVILPHGITASDPASRARGPHGCPAPRHAFRRLRCDSVLRRQDASPRHPARAMRTLREHSPLDRWRSHVLSISARRPMERQFSRRRVRHRGRGYEGLVRVPRHVFQALLDQSPTPERCLQAYHLYRTRLELIAERKVRSRHLTDDGNVVITGRDLRHREFRSSTEMHGQAA
jgi:hypothetical protein